jgi:hypothetical protein
MKWIEKEKESVTIRLLEKTKECERRKGKLERERRKNESEKWNEKLKRRKLDFL